MSKHGQLTASAEAEEYVADAPRQGLRTNPGATLSDPSTGRPENRRTQPFRAVSRTQEGAATDQDISETVSEDTLETSCEGMTAMPTGAAKISEQEAEKLIADATVRGTGASSVATQGGLRTGLRDQAKEAAGGETGPGISTGLGTTNGPRRSGISPTQGAATEKSLPETDSEGNDDAMYSLLPKDQASSAESERMTELDGNVRRWVNTSHEGMSKMPIGTKQNSEQRTGKLIANSVTKVGYGIRLLSTASQNEVPKTISATSFTDDRANSASAMIERAWYSASPVLPRFSMCRLHGIGVMP